MTPTFFTDQTGFRKWLEKNHKKENELLVGYYKVNSGIPCMTWSQSVDEALCFGWIDGIRRSIDSQSYCIRFTPRRPTSIWSAINIKKVEELTKQGLMYPAGLESFKNRKDDKSKIYSFESDPIKLTDDFERKFKANKPAWDFFSAQPPSYKKRIMHWIMTAKQEETKLGRLFKTIKESEKQNRIY